ncbi:hypothetical protein H2248_009356 [Termitomyces sp. 'cryptogamus']|nr:hypothetical protein H2248_009356 [Termitomyces sp. 'cryptogamus']
MPSHNPVDPIPPVLDRPAQPKVCPSCQSSLVDAQTNHDGPVCPTCKEPVPRSHRSDFPWRYSQNTRQIPKLPLFDDEMIVDVPATSARPCYMPLCTNIPHANAKKPTTLCHVVDNVPQSYGQLQTTTVDIARRQAPGAPYPSPLIDITRIRVRSNGSDCLYPGATFRGIQKSGRNNYDVDVSIVDVNFASSYLCGYLRIRGLTDDHPDLTTYFDAEIIGTRYGFLTRNWGATEQEDLTHWSRFPAFHDIKDELKKPHMKLADRDRSIVFMRWKERFLVPNHRVSEINGASFAGFYYICVEFNPPPPPRRSSHTRSTIQPLPASTENVEMTPSDPTSKSEVPRQPRRDSVESTARRAAERVPSLASRSPPAAKMTGFYYHRNSEPYQQLTLFHDAERVGSSFELR